LKKRGQKELQGDIKERSNKFNILVEKIRSVWFIEYVNNVDAPILKHGSKRTLQRWRGRWFLISQTH